MKFICSECGYEFPVKDDGTVICTCPCVRDRLSDLESVVYRLQRELSCYN